MTKVSGMGSGLKLNEPELDEDGRSQMDKGPER